MKAIPNPTLFRDSDIHTPSDIRDHSQITWSAKLVINSVVDPELSLPLVSNCITDAFIC